MCLVLTICAHYQQYSNTDSGKVSKKLNFFAKCLVFNGFVCQIFDDKSRKQCNLTHKLYQRHWKISNIYQKWNFSSPYIVIVLISVHFIGVFQKNVSIEIKIKITMIKNAFFTHHRYFVQGLRNDERPCWEVRLSYTKS